jgi:protein-tyrosine phosphatase
LRPQLLDWRSSRQPSHLLRQAAAVLRLEEMVAFPTETGYALAANALAPNAVARLASAAGVGEADLAIGLGRTGAVRDWVPGLSPLGERLARRCWPGPVTLRFEDGARDGLAARLPESVRARLLPDGRLGLRVPYHEAPRLALRRLPFPVLLADVPAASAEQAAAAGGEAVGLVIDDGPAEAPQANTVVQVSGSAWGVVREGVVPADELARQSVCLVVFLCTGNTCRSPLAEALCKKRLADRIGCTVAELPQRGFLVVSAGLAAGRGEPAAREAVAAAADLGADLTAHASRPAGADLLGQADCLVAMTRGHLAALRERFPQLPLRPRLLCGADDLSDPLGGDEPVYRACAQTILNHLDGILAELAPL